MDLFEFQIQCFFSLAKQPYYSLCYTLVLLAFKCVVLTLSLLLQALVSHLKYQLNLGVKTQNCFSQQFRMALFPSDCVSHIQTVSNCDDKSCLNQTQMVNLFRDSISFERYFRQSLLSSLAEFSSEKQRLCKFKMCRQSCQHCKI